MKIRSNSAHTSPRTQKNFWIHPCSSTWTPMQFGLYLLLVTVPFEQPLRSDSALVNKLSALFSSFKWCFRNLELTITITSSILVKHPEKACKNCKLLPLFKLPFLLYYTIQQ